MKLKKKIDTILITFALSSFLWCFAWSFMLGKISKKYEDKIELLCKN